jgi:hypothetical protein
MIYLGGAWPAEYRNAIVMNNIHGHRANVDRLERAGSGYAATHAADFLNANDAWSQMLNFRYGPDGAVHVIDWYDKNQCHSTNPEIHQKTLGRIFTIRHESHRPVKVDLRRLPSSELVALQLHRNDWYVQHARRLLQERGPDPDVHARLRLMLREQSDVTRRLRALWALHVTGGTTEADLLTLTSDGSEYVRSWAVALLSETPPSPGIVAVLTRLAQQDPSALVRLYVASALQRVAPNDRWDAVAALMARGEDAADRNLPLMIWYAAEPLVAIDMERAMRLADASPVTRLYPFVVSRIAAEGTPAALLILADRLGHTADAARQKVLLDGITRIVNAPDSAPAQREDQP